MTASQLNWLDRVVAAISPMAGVRRGQARMALDVLRKYEAAEVSRRTTGWKAASTSANVEIEASIDRVRARSSQMVRDNEYAKAAIRALTTHIVGTGITVIPKLKAERERLARLERRRVRRRRPARSRRPDAPGLLDLERTRRGARPPPLAPGG